ncbi:MAG: carboxypeptidase-like regulatory domain-containing protein [Fidelibacterota bacterium]
MKQYFVIIALFFATIAQAEVPAPQLGGIRGVVIDSHTEQPLPGVNVYILDSGIGTATDAEGRFDLEKLAPGSYHVCFEMMGYKPQTKLNLPVSPDRYLELTIRLQQTVLEMQDIVVTPDFFKKAKDAVISDRSVDFTEIISDPGSSMDVQRMMQTLPSVVSGTDQYNEVIVRGGAPGENLFVLDHIEIPNPNHFGDQGSGGGPIGMLNPCSLVKWIFMRVHFQYVTGIKPVR